MNFPSFFARYAQHDHVLDVQFVQSECMLRVRLLPMSVLSVLQCGYGHQSQLYVSHSHHRIYPTAIHVTELLAAQHLTGRESFHSSMPHLVSFLIPKYFVRSRQIFCVNYGKDIYLVSYPVSCLMLTILLEFCSLFNLVFDHF